MSQGKRDVNIKNIWRSGQIWDAKGLRGLRYDHRYGGAIQDTKLNMSMSMLKYEGQDNTKWWYASSVYNDENNQNIYKNTTWGATEGYERVSNPSYNEWDEIIIEFYVICSVQ